MSSQINSGNLEEQGNNSIPMKHVSAPINSNNPILDQETKAQTQPIERVLNFQLQLQSDKGMYDLSADKDLCIYWEQKFSSETLTYIYNKIKSQISSKFQNIQIHYLSEQVKKKQKNIYYDEILEQQKQDVPINSLFSGSDVIIRLVAQFIQPQFYN